MARKLPELDFLIVTALDVETAAVRRFLEEEESRAHGFVGKITREDGRSSYDVGIVESGQMGNNASQLAAALFGLNSPRVILTGIAAGFPESGVQPGDVMAPYFVIDYELAKVKERRLGFAKRLCLKVMSRLFPGADQALVSYEHRAPPMRVSYTLWHTANTLAKDPSWADVIREPRPDGSSRAPCVHSKSTSYLGSGNKLVASVFSRTRQWLLKEFGAVGLEMESIGVLTFCLGNAPGHTLKAGSSGTSSRICCQRTVLLVRQ